MSISHRKIDSLIDLKIVAWIDVLLEQIGIWRRKRPELGEEAGSELDEAGPFTWWEARLAMVGL